MRYLNYNDDILSGDLKLEPIGIKPIDAPKVNIQPQLTNTNLTSTTSAIKEERSGLGTWLSKESTGDLLQSGLEVFSAVRGQRQASGKAATRQEKLAKCGRRPLTGLNAKGLSKSRYDKCVQELESGTTTTQVGNVGGYDGSKSMQNQDGGSNYIKWIIGGVVVLGLGFFAYKKFAK